MSDETEKYEKRKIVIEKCATQRTKFFLNGKSYRILQEKLIELFKLSSVEMSKLYLGYKIERIYPKHVCDEIYKQLDEINKITIL